MIEIKQLSELVTDKYRGSDLLQSNTIIGWTGYISNKRCGNTTRQIDYAIQQLFNNGFVVCLDHHYFGEHIESNRRLFLAVLRRLNIEHPNIHLYDDKVKADKFVIKLLR